MRRKYAKWWNLDALLPEQMDEIRQCVESGSPDEVALVAADCDQKAEELADRCQDVSGEYLVKSGTRRLLLLRSHAWAMARDDSRDRMMGLIQVLEQTLQLAREADPARSGELQAQCADLLSQYPAIQERFTRPQE